jgi:hypothetical protein
MPTQNRGYRVEVKTLTEDEPSVVIPLKKAVLMQILYNCHQLGITGWLFACNNSRMDSGSGPACFINTFILYACTIQYVLGSGITMEMTRTWLVGIASFASSTHYNPRRRYVFSMLVLRMR